MAPLGKAEFERRAFPRFKLDIPIYYELEVQTWPARAGRTCNISESGLLVYLSEPVAIGDRLRVQLHLTDPKAPRMLEAVGQVIWVRPVPDSAPMQFKAGLRFEEIRPEDLVFIRQFESLWLEQEL